MSLRRCCTNDACDDAHKIQSPVQSSESWSSVAEHGRQNTTIGLLELRRCRPAACSTATMAMVSLLRLESTWLFEDIIQTEVWHLESAEPHPKSIAKLSLKSTHAQLRAKLKLSKSINVSKLE